MQVMELLNQLGGLQSVARELGVDEAQVTAGATALMPALLGGFKKQVQAQPAGLDGLAGMLGHLGGGGLLDDVLGPQPTNVGRGNDVLGQVFGSPDVSRTVAQNAASRSGIDPALLKKMLPMLAMLVAGYLAKQNAGQAAAPAGAGQDGGLGDGLDGGLGGLLGGLLGQGGGPQGKGLAGMLDLDGDGNPLDDIMGLAGKFLR
jgi:hypothetical protein